MWKYIRPYLFTATAAGLFMVGEVLMDLVQPGIMRRIVDEGVLASIAGALLTFGWSGRSACRWVLSSCWAGSAAP